MADVLNRTLAPIPDAAWEEIDQVARQRLTANLSARNVMDMTGPAGFDFSAVGTGRTGKMSKTGGGVQWGLRELQPLIEARVPFQMPLAEIENVARGAKDVDWEPLETAARKIATFEETAIYKGLAAANVAGVLKASGQKPVPLTVSVEKMPAAIGAAMQQLQEAGIGGPYHLVLGTKSYKPMNLTLNSGRTLRSVTENLLGGGVYWSPALEGGVLLSSEDEYFEIAVGQDLAIGYARQTGDAVDLFFIETFTARVLEPAAAVELKVRA